MKQFFKFMFASMIGFILSFVVAFLILLVTVSSIISSSSSEKQPSISSNSVLKIELAKPIQDRPSDNPFDNFDFSSFSDKTPLSLKNIIDNIAKAKNDDRIKGIYLDIPFLQANMASIEEIRKALIDFKSSGKFLVSYSENYSQGVYYLSSVADKIYLNPAGEMTFKGLSTELMFFKDALNRLDIDMQIIRHGKFKSAIEPFIRENMSDANREQMSTLVNSIWGGMVGQLAEARNISVESLNEMANGLLIRSAESALEKGLVDGLIYEDEVMALLMEKLEIEKEDDLNFVGMAAFNKVRPSLDKDKKQENGLAFESPKSKNKLAIIFAEGEIISGESQSGKIGSNTLAAAIKAARKDDKVKAIVLRVNSPGGSALASDVMWREVVLAKEVKPVVVSMGGVAASGGYYIACAADKIFAESSTITGSIGVFGVIPNVEGMLKSKLGVDIDRVTTHDYSDGLTLLRPMRETERVAIQQNIESIYDDFTQKVADGRGMSQAEVDSIGQGRVWSGTTAREIGLVDEIGGLHAAINEAALLAELEDYKIKEFPEKEDPIEKLMKDLGQNVKLELFGPEYGIAEKYYSNFKQVMNAKGIYTRLPVDIIID